MLTNPSIEANENAAGNPTFGFAAFVKKPYENGPPLDGGISIVHQSIGNANTPRKAVPFGRAARRLRKSG